MIFVSNRGRGDLFQPKPILSHRRMLSSPLMSMTIKSLLCMPAHSNSPVVGYRDSPTPGLPSLFGEPLRLCDLTACRLNVKEFS